MAGAWRKPLPHATRDESFPGLGVAVAAKAQARTECQEMQDDELVALQHIYGEDYFPSTKGQGAWNKSDASFGIRVSEPVGDESMSLFLAVQFTATYPKSPPILALKDCVGMPEATVYKIQKMLETISRGLANPESPHAMIYDIVEPIREAVREAAAAKTQGMALPSLEEERARHNAELRRRAEELGKAEERRREEAAREDARTMSQMVGVELERQKQKGRGSKAAKIGPRAGAEAGGVRQKKDPEESVVRFDPACEALDANGNIMAFKAVTDKTPLRTGPVSKVFTVKPRLADHGDHGPVLVLKETVLRAGDRDAKKFKDAVTALERCLESVKARLGRRKHIVEVFDYRIEIPPAHGPGLDAYTVRILSPWAIKGSLEELLQLADQLQIAKVKAWTRDLLDALTFMHNAQIVHQNIHPGNVLLAWEPATGEVVPKLADAGYQRHLHNINSAARGGAALPGMGTARSSQWLPAEIATSTRPQYTTKSDIWDFGVVFLQMVFGLGVVTRYTSPSDLRRQEALSGPFLELVDRFFHVDPRKRSRPFELGSAEFFATSCAVYRDEHPDPMTLMSMSSPAVRPFSSSPAAGQPVLPPPTGRFRRESGARPPASSRYEEDYDELGRLGKGGYGEVVKARRKLDGQVYAIKKITQKSRESLTEVLKEIRLLAGLSHPAVVRYHTTWIEETEDDSPTDSSSEDESGSESESGPGQEQGREDSLPFEFALSTGRQYDFISTGAKAQVDDDDDDDDDTDDDDTDTDDDDDDDDNDDDYNDEDDEDDEDEDEDDGDKDEEERGGKEEEENSDVAVEFESEVGSVKKGSSQILAARSSLMPKYKTTLYIAMEYCDKRSLRDLIMSNNLWRNTQEIWRLLRQVVEGLDHIHHLNIVHRDLKPENVFLSRGPNGAEQAKIGDFGLATSGQFAVDKVAASSLAPDRLTSNIGTASYAAPEVRSGGPGTYSNKVDMYSLGIMFFEMCYHALVGMERADVVGRLRAPEPSFPADFEPAESAQAEIILSLLEHDPARRPSSAELLRSGNIPVSMESEPMKHALASLADPTSAANRTRLASALFSRDMPPARDFAYDVAAAEARPSTSELVGQRHVKDVLTSIFRRHGALEIRRSPLYPRSPHYKNENIVEVLDPHTNVLQLPWDLTLGMARMLAKSGGEPVSRAYTFGTVYRDRRDSAQPLMFGEVDFDIVTTDTLDLALREAEVLKVLDEIIVEVGAPSGGQMCFNIGHSDLLHVVLEACGVRPQTRRQTAEVLSKLNIHGYSWPKARAELRSSGVGLSDTTVNELQRFDFRDTPNKAWPKLKSLLENDTYQRAAPAIAHLQEVVEYTKRMKFATRIYISPLHSLKEDFCTGGIIFAWQQDKKDKDVFAAGGRYDSLIREQGLNMGGAVERHAVGFGLAWERLAGQGAKAGQKPGKSKKKDEEDGHKRLDVLVGGFNPETLRSTGVEVLATLWSHNVSAQLAGDARTPEELVADNRHETASWLVLVKEGSMLKVRCLARREVADVEIAVTQLPSWIRQEFRDRDIRWALKARGTFNSSHDAGLAGGSGGAAGVGGAGSVGGGGGGGGGGVGGGDYFHHHHRQRVVVLSAQSKSKKVNRSTVVEQAEASAARLVHAFLDNQILAVETADKTMELIRTTTSGVADTDGWKRLEGSVPTSERKYVREIYDMLATWSREPVDEGEQPQQHQPQQWSSSEKKKKEAAAAAAGRGAFVYNFRSGTCIYYPF